MMKKLSLALALFAAAACSPVDQLKWEAPKDAGFARNLASEYADFAANLQELGHQKQADAMARKGLSIKTEGKAPKPEPASDAALSADYRRLVKALEQEPRRVISQTAARAQVLYDCQTLEEALPSELVADCKTEFDAALKALESVLHDLTPKYQHVIYFAEDSAALSPDSYRQLGQITSQLLATEKYSITVAGHSAPTKDSKADWILALKRAQRVADALMEAGVPESKMQVSSLGNGAPPRKVTDPKRLNRVAIRIDVPQEQDDK